MPRPHRWLRIVPAVFLIASLSAGIPQGPSLHVTLDLDEAEAVLSILEARTAGERVPDEAWSDLFGSAGYVRLKEREAAMDRSFTDGDFRDFVLSDTLAARVSELRSTLETWRDVDVTTAAARAFEYLPDGTVLSATIYPSIKPMTNSFVFGIGSDPAIFMYLDPELSPPELENTLAHELHHIGLGGVCRDDSRPVGALSRALRWTGAFGEGIAMLAAAGGPETHPHASSAAAERARWDRDMAEFAADLRELESFFLAILDDELTEEEEVARARSYYGIQGPWYTVGWRMARQIEQVHGRGRLLEVLCDGPGFLAAYNEAAGEDGNVAPSERWSSELIDRLSARP